MRRAMARPGPSPIFTWPTPCGLQETPSRFVGLATTRLQIPAPEAVRSRRLCNAAAWQAPRGRWQRVSSVVSRARQRFPSPRRALRRRIGLLGAAGAGSAVLLGTSWELSPALNVESVHRVEWTTEQVRDLLREYQNARTLQNYCVALGIVGLGLFDLAMLTSTGVFGLLVGTGGVVAYVYDNLRAVNGDETGRVRFIDVSEPHEELIGAGRTSAFPTRFLLHN